jgi:hypothetical protein
LRLERLDLGYSVDHGLQHLGEKEVVNMEAHVSLLTVLAAQVQVDALLVGRDVVAAARPKEPT